MYMKNPDVFSRRFLAVTIGISAILLSGSLFLFSLKGISTATAIKHNDVSERNGKLYANLHTNNKVIPLQDDTQDDDIEAIYAFGIGIRDGNLYFGILYSNNTIGLHRSPAEGEDVLDW